MEDDRHAERVDRWLAQAAKGLSEERRLLLFEQALGALWRRAHVTLGEITLGAVTERVLYFATEKYPFLAPIKVDQDGVHFEGLEESLSSHGHTADTDAFRFVLVEFLSVLGNLTDEIITPALHSELSKVAIRETNPRKPRSQADEERAQ